MTLSEFVSRFKNNHTYVKRFEIYDREGKTIDGDIRLNDAFMDIFSDVPVLIYISDVIGNINRYDDNWDSIRTVDVLIVRINLDCDFKSAVTNW